MRILKPGDPCPCCGQPLKEGLPTGTVLLLSWLVEGKALADAGKGMNLTASAERSHDER